MGRRRGSSIGKNGRTAGRHPRSQSPADQEGSLVVVALGDRAGWPCVGAVRGSVWGTGVVGGPEQVWHDASVQLQDGAHTEQVHDLV